MPWYNRFMPRPFSLRPVRLRLFLLALLVLLPAPPLAFLCRGRTPTRFDAVNLPVWERPASAASPFRRTARTHGALRGNVKHRAKVVS
jgi:hypothetical protein